MAIAKLKRVQILAHTDLKQDLLASLQEEGFIHIDACDCAEMGLAAPAPASAHDRDDLDHTIFRLSQALEFLEQFGDRRRSRRLFKARPEIQSAQRKDVLKNDYVSLMGRIEALKAERNELLAEASFLAKEMELLSPLQNLDIPIKSIAGTRITEVRFGSLPANRLRELEAWEEDRAVCVYSTQSIKRDVYVFLIFLKDEAADLDQSLKELAFDPFYFTGSMLDKIGPKDMVKDLSLNMQRRQQELENDLVDLDQAVQALTAHEQVLMQVYDVLVNEREMLVSSQMLGQTEKVLYLAGWVRSADVTALEEKLKPYYDLVECTFRSPLPEEDPPVVLENPKAGQPFELVTRLYGLPRKGTLDPTPFLIPFFFLFVGLTVSEAGYGLLVTVLSLLYLWMGKPKGGIRQFLILLAILGGANVIIGTLVGGWFGFPIRQLLILDPLQDPVSFLILALALGFIQVWFGTFLKMVSLLKQKEYSQAFFVQGGWLLLLPGLVLYVLTKGTLWGIITLVGVGGIVFFASPSRNPLARFFGGLYGLYDISGYLSDILSYSRLLALGLATSVIAMVVNTLCETALGIPWVGWLFAGLIFVGGHLFNLGISFLGGFVHSMRLQFVEFFSKFFQSGGKPFKPFELQSKYVEFL